MPSPDALIRATMHRLAARLGHGLAEAAAEVAVIAQDAPERLRREWDLFQDEVRAEAERLDADEKEPSDPAQPAGPAGDVDPQQQIDGLRARVAELSRLMEETP
jgi:uncharacterized protein YceH (UPF0502 family)